MARVVTVHDGEDDGEEDAGCRDQRHSQRHQCTRRGAAAAGREGRVLGRRGGDRVPESASRRTSAPLAL